MCVILSEIERGSASSVAGEPIPTRRSEERFGLLDRSELLELLAELVAYSAIIMLQLMPSSRLSNACGLAPELSNFNQLADAP